MSSYDLVTLNPALSFFSFARSGGSEKGAQTIFERTALPVLGVGEVHVGIREFWGRGHRRQIWAVRGTASSLATFGFFGFRV